MPRDRIGDELGRNAVVAQGVVKLVRLRHRHAHIAGRGENESRRSDPRGVSER